MSLSVTLTVLRELAQGTGPAAGQAEQRLIWIERGRRHAQLGLKPLPKADLIGRGRLVFDAYMEGFEQTVGFSFKSRAPRGL